MNKCLKSICFIFSLLFCLFAVVCDKPIQQQSPSIKVYNAPVKLRFTYWGSADERRAIEYACKKFTEKYPWITVETIHIINQEYRAKLIAMAARNDLPDFGYMTGDVGEIWALEGKFINIFNLLNTSSGLKKEDFLDNVWFKLSPANAWGVNTGEECFGLYYNKDLLKAAGISSLPVTAEKAMDWNTFVNIARKLTIDKNGKSALDPEFDPNHIVQYGFMFDKDNNPINNFIFSNGGQWISKDGSKFILNSPETAEALQKLSDLVNVYHVSPSLIESNSLPDLSIALQTKLAAMVLGGQWINLDLGNAKVNYDIGVLPKLKKSITVELTAPTVFFKSSAHPNEAWKLFEWLSNPENSIELYSSGLWMPVIKKWYTDPNLIKRWVDVNPYAHPAGFKDAMMNQLLKNGVPTTPRYLCNSSRIFSIVMSSLDPLWIGKMTAKDVLDRIDIKIENEFKAVHNFYEHDF